MCALPTLRKHVARVQKQLHRDATICNPLSRLKHSCCVRYLIGTDMIHKLRADLAAEYGEAFCLRDFHDTFLSYGSIPVKLISDDMRRRSFGKLPLAGHALRAAL